MARPIISSVLLVFLIFFFQLFILSLSALAVSLDPSQYGHEFSALGVYDQFGKERVLEVNEKVLMYLAGKTRTLETDFFNGREISHLGDVKKVFGALSLIIVLFSAVFIVAVVFAKEKKRTIGTMLVGGSAIVLGIMGILAIAVVIDFGGAFSLFHELFFAPDTYLFDPATENIVNLYPEALFASFAMKISLLSAILCLIFLFGGLCMRQGIGKH